MEWTEKKILKQKKIPNPHRRSSLSLDFQREKPSHISLFILWDNTLTVIVSV